MPSLPAGRTAASSVQSAELNSFLLDNANPKHTDRMIGDTRRAGIRGTQRSLLQATRPSDCAYCTLIMLNLSCLTGFGLDVYISCINQNHTTRHEAHESWVCVETWCALWKPQWGISLNNVQNDINSDAWCKYPLILSSTQKHVFIVS